jgi:hypothetical protein
VWPAPGCREIRAVGVLLLPLRPWDPLRGKAVGSFTEGPAEPQRMVEDQRYEYGEALIATQNLPGVLPCGPQGEDQQMLDEQPHIGTARQ